MNAVKNKILSKLMLWLVALSVYLIYLLYD